MFAYVRVWKNLTHMLFRVCVCVWKAASLSYIQATEEEEELSPVLSPST